MNDSEYLIIQTLIDCPLHQIAVWAEDHSQLLNLTFLEQCKEVSDNTLRSKPDISNDLTERMIWLSKHVMDNEPMASPLAVWARGNWASLHHPSQALQFYQTASESYATSEKSIEMARIFSNIVAVSVICARFQDALDAYQIAHPILENLAGKDREYLLSLKQNYGILLHYLGRYEEAMDAYNDAKNLAQELNRMDSWSEIQVNQACTMAMLGQLNRSEEMLLDSRRIADHSESHITVEQIDLNLGTLYTVQGHFANALRVFQQAKQTSSILNNSMEKGYILLYEALLLEKMGTWLEAGQGYDRAKTYFTELDMQFEVGITLTLEGSVKRQYGEYQQAKQLLHQASDTWARLEQPRWQVQTLLEQAALSLAYQQSEKALELLAQCKNNVLSTELTVEYYALLANVQKQRWQQTDDPALYQAAYRAYEDMLSYSEEHSGFHIKRRALAGLGELMQDSDRKQAYSILEEAVGYDEQVRQTLSVQELKASFQNQTGEVLPLLIRMALEDGQPERALRYVWRAKGSSLLELFQSARDAKLSLENPISHKAHSQSNKLAVEIEQTRQDLAKYRWQVLCETNSDISELVIEQHYKKIGQLEARLHELRRQRNHVASAASIQSIRHADPNQILQNVDVDVLIEYIRCDDEIFAIRVDLSRSVQDSICYQATRLVDIETLFDLIDELELAMRPAFGMMSNKRAQQLPYLLAECQPLLQRMYEYLIEPLGKLPTDAKLLIAPDSLLNGLPFAALWDGQHYLVERFSLEITPTAALALDPVKHSNNRPPLLIGASAEGELPGVSKEIQTIHRLLPKSTMLLDDPNYSRYFTKLEVPPRILHLAGHVTRNMETPLLDALQLAEGFLSVEQCYELPLQGTQLVTLSADMTPSGMDSSSSLLSFQSAFFVAGAEQVVSAIWPINDEATCHWMTHFYTHLAAGEEPSTALQLTQRALINDPAYAHPAIWASFICSRRW